MAPSFSILLKSVLCCKYMIPWVGSFVSLQNTLQTPTYTGVPYPLSTKSVFYSLYLTQKPPSPGVLRL